MINYRTKARKENLAPTEWVLVNISQLEYFVTTVQCGSFSTAAKELFVTPQAVSKAVGELERELHVQLCEKSGRSVSPTPFGRMFSTRASEALSCLLDLEALARNHELAQEQEGLVSLAVACSPCRGNVLRTHDFDAFEKTCPRIKLTASFHSSGACLAALEEGIVDAAVVIGRVCKPGVDSVRLLSFPLHLAVSKGNPLASRPFIELEDLKGTPLAMPEDIRYCQTIITNHLEAKGLEPCYTVLPPFAAEHRAFLEDQNGAMFVADDPSLEDLYPSIVVLPIASGDLMPIPLCLAYASNRANPALPFVERYLLGIAARIRRGRR